jgi:hypothetical protein
VRFKDARGGLQRELDYALKYADKMRRKAYQQRYDTVPRELRTFSNQRLEIPPDELRQHLDQDVWQYRCELTYGTRDIHPVLVYSHTLVHDIPQGGRCTAIDHRRARRGQMRARAPNNKKGSRPAV